MTTFLRLRLLQYIIILFITAVSYGPGLSAEYENFTASLNLIKEIYVDVKPIDNPIVTDAGINEDLIKVSAERQLRRAGIKLLNKDRYNQYKMTLNYPLARLEIRLTVHEIEGMDAVIAEIRTRVVQVAFLSRRPIIQINAPSWEVQEIGIVSDPSFLDAALQNSLDKFIDDYFTANPR